MGFGRHQFCITILMSLATLMASAENLSQKPIRSSGIPPGFENLLEPQTTEIDVYYGGAYLLSTFATFTPGSILFLDPLSVIEKVPDLLDKKLVQKSLEKEMATNSALVCLKPNQSACGKISAAIVEVIFDENQFRADIFISPTLLAVRSATENKFLPPSNSGLSLLNVIGATLNGQKGGSSNYNISNSTTLALRESRLLAISNYTKNEDFTFDTLALQREFRGRQYQAGYFRSSPSGMIFIREADFLGISLASSLDTRKDLDQSSGNELQLFLDSRSRVELLKDGRLISSHIYETGNQIIDTSKLPGGAYDIVLRIRDNFGSEKEETRFYSKTNLLPPKDQSLFFFDIGERVDKNKGDTLPKANGVDLLRAGISKRISSNFGGDLGFVYSDNIALLEAGIFKLGRNYDLRFNLALGSEDARGASLNGNFRLGRISISGNLRKTWSEDSRSIIGAPSMQGTLNVSMPFRKSSLSITARYNKRGADTDKNLGLRYDLPNYSFGNKTLFTDLQVSQNNDEFLVLLGARISLRKNRWQNDIRTRLYYDEQENLDSKSGLISHFSSLWQDGDRFLSDIDVSLRAIDERSDRFAEAEFNIESNLGRGNFDLTYSAENSTTSYGANFYTSILANKNTFSIGGRSQARSAIVLDIKGDIDNAFFDVEVNRIIRENAQIGKKTIISLPPYQTYEVRLLPRGESLVDFGNKTKIATLYPGNIVTFKWEATRVLVAFGQITNKAGKAIPNALINGVIGLATTDEFGLFQAEIESNAQSFLVKTRSSECRVKLPEFSTDSLIVTLGTLACE